MKTLLYLVTFVIPTLGNPETAVPNPLNSSSSFKMSINTIGFGSNRFIQQPQFRIIDTKFVYTLENSWAYKDQVANQPDTLLVGSLNYSSIDSINSIVNRIQDTLVYRSSRTMSGVMVCIEIENKHSRLKFKLWNSTDTRAQQIIDIINNYIPEAIQPLRIPDFGSSLPDTTVPK